MGKVAMRYFGAGRIISIRYRMNIGSIEDGYGMTMGPKPEKEVG
jgi:hypothetical protein